MVLVYKETGLLGCPTGMDGWVKLALHGDAGFQTTGFMRISYFRSEDAFNVFDVEKGGPKKFIQL
jgi:hypothetical protein